jgi:hypothetical protein
MKDHYIPPTRNTLEVKLETNGNLLFRGISTPENIKKFMSPIIDWLNEFKQTAPKKLTVNFEINYFNTVSSRYFYEFILIIDSFKEHGCEISFNWYYEEDDDDLIELGEEFEQSAQVKFNYFTT